MKCSNCKCILCEVSEEELKKLGLSLKPVTYKAGNTIFEQGAPVHDCYIICKGLVKLARFTTPSEKQILKFLRSGDLLAWDAFAESKWHSIYAEVVEEAQVIHIVRRDLLALAQRFPGVAAKAFKGLAKDVLCLQARLVANAYGSVQERLAASLWALEEFYGSEKSGGGKVIGLKLTCEDLAEMIGSSRQTVNQVLLELKKRGLIAIQSHRITILNEEGLRALVEHLL